MRKLSIRLVDSFLSTVKVNRGFFQCFQQESQGLTHTHTHQNTKRMYI